MKKTIKILLDKMDKLQEKKDGTLQGGFASIKGGFTYADSTNEGACSNSGNCTRTTNTGTPTCSNSGTCFF